MKNRFNQTTAILFVCMIVLMHTGCSNTQHVKVTLPAAKSNPQLAGQLNDQAMIKVQEDQPLEAIALLRSAISADANSARSHNNLGKVYFQEEQFADALIQFNKAIKLDQGKNPQPLNNAGMIYERAGKLELAIELYTQAHKLEPENILYTANIARAMHRNGDRSEKLIELLDQIILQDSRDDWRQWALNQKSKIVSRQPVTE